MDTAVPFNAADLIALVFVVVCIAIGIKRGLIGLIAPIVGLIIIATAVRFGYAPCRDWMTTHLTFDASVLRLGALAVVIGIPLVLMILIRKLLGELVKLPILSGIDRLGGALAGLIAGVLFVLVVFFVLGILPKPYQSPAVKEGSWIGRHVTIMEEDIIGAVSQRVDRTEGAILKAREDRASRRETWEP
jgi:membrane protein required for colicin V production